MKRLLTLCLIGLVLTTMVNSCKPGTVTQNSPPPGAIVVWPNVHIIDSTQWMLTNAYGQPGNGDYSYGFTTHTPYIDVHVGDIIVGVTNGGYIRKVLATSLANDRLNLFTQPATMADIFKSGTFTLQIPIIDSANPSSQSIFRSYSNVNLSNVPGFDLDLVYSQFNIQPTIDLTFTFDSAVGLTNFQMSTSNVNSKDSLSIFAFNTETRGWSNGVNLANFAVKSTQWIQAWGNISVPIVMKFNMSLNAGASGSLAQNSDSLQVKAYWGSNCTYTAGLQYTGGQWHPLHSGVAYNTLEFDTNPHRAISNIFVNATDQITSSFYTVAGPQITIGFNGTIGQAIRNPFNYNQGTTIWSSITDAQIGIPNFGRNMPQFNQSWTFDSVFFETPYTFVYVSGDSQTGNIIQTLPNPLVVKIFDSNGNPAPNTLVTFSIVGTTAQGMGFLDGTNTILFVLTDHNGLAQATWTLGPHQGTQQVTATVVNGAPIPEPISGAPHTFTAIGQ